MKRCIRIVVATSVLGICFLCLLSSVNRSYLFANAQTDEIPPKRNISQLAYDSGSDRIIMYGGLKTWGLTDDHYNDTWAYDYNSNSWNNMEPSVSPPKRGGNSLAYDEESDRIVLFGGWYTGAADTSVMWNDTWAYDYDSNTWINKTTELKPPGRAMAPAVYDSESDVIILFGGGIDGFELNSETWVYDYNTNTWTNMNPINSPSARVSVMAYDSESDRVILFGGGVQEGGIYVTISTDTWAYDYNTNTWTVMNPVEHPESMGNMVYDEESDKIIMFGGSRDWFSEDLISETWRYDYNTNTWEEMNPSPSPDGRHFLSMAYDSESDRTILFNGGWWTPQVAWHAIEDCWAYDLNSDTWEMMISSTTTPTTPTSTTTTTTSTTQSSTTTSTTSTTPTPFPLEWIAFAAAGVLILVVIVVYVKMKKV